MTNHRLLTSAEQRRELAKKKIELVKPPFPPMSVAVTHIACGEPRVNVTAAWVDWFAVVLGLTQDEVIQIGKGWIEEVLRNHEECLGKPVLKEQGLSTGPALWNGTPVIISAGAGAGGAAPNSISTGVTTGEPGNADYSAGLTWSPIPEEIFAYRCVGGGGSGVMGSVTPAIIVCADGGIRHMGGKKDCEE